MTSSAVSGSAHNFAAGPKWHCRIQCVDAEEACSKTITRRALSLPSTRRLLESKSLGKKGNRPPGGLRRYLVNLLRDLAVTTAEMASIARDIGVKYDSAVSPLPCQSLQLAVVTGLTIIAVPILHANGISS